MQSPSRPSRSVEPEVRPKAANAVEAHKEKFMSKRNAFEESLHRDQLDSFHDPRSMFGEALRVEETKTMETDYVHSNDRINTPVIQSARSPANK